MSLRDRDILNLPDAPDFVSNPPEISFSEMIAFCEKMLPYWNELRYSKPELPILGEPFRLIDEDKK